MPQAHIAEVDGTKGVLLLAGDDSDQEAIFKQYGLDSSEPATFSAGVLTK